MSDQMRILVVEDEEQLNHSMVNSLRKDGYFVQGVRSGAEATRMVWSEEYDVVIGDLKTPGADGFELLQWLRTYRPKTHMIMVTAFGSADMRTQALEAGVMSYLEKPLNLHLLKEELRRLLQQTGFSASLDSFDLLDVIQIVTMSRKNIALLVNTGLEEHGTLRFQGGELIWAEYGILRGEEAFFALAAHKNGTVIHQPWNDQITPNVTQPLSRLIFQALQYRSKYAAMRQPTGEQAAIGQAVVPVQVLDDDSPFMVLAEEGSFIGNGGYEHIMGNSNGNGGMDGKGNTGNTGSKEWWQPSEKIPIWGNTNGAHAADSFDPTVTPPSYGQTPPNGSTIVPTTVHKMPTNQRDDLPAWLTEQPTRSDIPLLRPSSLSNTAKVPSAPPPKSSPAEWQPIPTPTPPPQASTTQHLPTRPQKTLTKSGAMGRRRTGSPEWQPSQPTSSGSLFASSRRTSDALSLNEGQESGSLAATGKMNAQHPQKRNYTALVAALQTLGYAIPGFVATAVVSLDGQPIAQVAIDDLDISELCQYFSTILQGALLSLNQGQWGNYEDMVITSAERHILLRIVGTHKSAFQVLITTHASEPSESLEVMANVEGAIGAAL